MRRLISYSFAILALIQFMLSITLSSTSLAQEWALRRPRGTLRVVDLFQPSVSVMVNYAEGLVTVDSENNWIPCLAKDWRWIDEQTIEFKLREDVTFHNGEKFNADPIGVNWEQYRAMESPRPYRWLVLPDETTLEKIDDYMVRFTFPRPDALVFTKFLWFPQIAPAFFLEHQFAENNWGYVPEAGPWGTGPYKFVQGSLGYVRPGQERVLEANEHYWDPQYPKVAKLIFDNMLIGRRDEALRLCRETEGIVDIVSYVRPLDTLKVAESPFAKVVKSRDVTLLVGWFNERRRGSKWRDVRLRKALNYAINRKELWKYAAKGNAYNLGGFIPPWGYGHNPDLTLYTYDTDKARYLLAEAGYSDGFEAKMIASEAWRLEAQIISKMLERIGVKVRLEVFKHPELFRRIYIPYLEKPPDEQDWDILIFHRNDWYGHTGASFLTVGLIEECNLRWIESDLVYEKMWEDMAGTVDKKKQEEKIRRMVQYIYDKAWEIYIYSPMMLYALNKEVDFVPQKLQLLRLKETSVTDSHWSLRGENQ